MKEQERADYFQLPRGATPESINPATPHGARYAEMLETRERQEMAEIAGLTTEELQSAEGVATQAASDALASGLPLQQALQVASDAGLAAVRAILRNRRDTLIKLATQDQTEQGEQA